MKSNRIKNVYYEIQLDWIYNAIGNGELKCNDAVLDRMYELYALIENRLF